MTGIQEKEIMERESAEVTITVGRGGDEARAWAAICCQCGSAFRPYCDQGTERDVYGNVKELCIRCCTDHPHLAKNRQKMARRIFEATMANFLLTLQDLPIVVDKTAKDQRGEDVLLALEDIAIGSFLAADAWIKRAEKEIQKSGGRHE